MVIAGGVLLIVGALLIVSGQTGTVRRDRANTEENPELSSQIENLEADVRGLREETRVGFESLSKQISELNANGSVSSSVAGCLPGGKG